MTRGLRTLPVCTLLLAACIHSTSAQNAVSQNTSTGEEDLVELSAFLVNEETDVGYAATESMGASRFVQDNLDVAGSVITVTNQLLQDTAATEALEAMAYVSGVQPASDRHPGHTQYSIRGYASGGINVRDGLSDPGDAADIPIDQSSSYERIEIIKGVAGTLYGSHNMGGIVNKVTKWPRSVQQTDLELQVHGGSDQYIRGVVDSSGPLGDGGTAYRVTLAHTDGERYYDEGDAPMQFTDLTALMQQRFDEGQGRVWGRFRYMRYELDREQGWQYLTGYLTPGQPAPTVTNPVFAVAKDANIVPEDDISIGNIYQWEAGYENRFTMFGGTPWTLRVVGRYSERWGDKSPSYSQGRPVAVDAQGNLLGDNRYISANDPEVADWRAGLTLRDFRGYRKNGGVNFDLVGDFDTGPARHKLILNSSVGMSEGERAFFFWGVANPDDPTSIGNTFSAVNPDFSGVNATTIPQNNEKQFNPFQGNARGEGFSAGIQDNVSFMDDRLIIVGGARYDYSRSTNHRFDRDASLAADRFVIDETATSTSTGDNWSFKGGAVFKVVEGVSLFGQISQTYNPISSVDTDGNKFPDQEGEMREIGVKTELLNGSVVATASLFQMELSNVLVNVPLPPDQGGGTAPMPVGAQDTDGYELDVAWTPMRGWTIQAAFSDLESTDANGNFFRGVPTEPNWSIFTKYEFEETGPLQGYFAGAGYRHNGRAPGDSGNSFFLDSNDVVDAFVGYRAQQWSVQLNVFNIFGTDAIISSVIDRLASRYEDTNYRLTARYRF